MFYTSVPHQHLHSFPTRRSSDLEGLPRPGVLGVDRHRGGDVVVDPVIGALVVVVRAAAGDGVGAHVGGGAGVGGVHRAFYYWGVSSRCSVVEGRTGSWGALTRNVG